MNIRLLYIFVLCCCFVFSHTLTTNETYFNTQLDSPKNIPGQNYSKGLCKELFSTSLKIQCFYEKNITSCDEPMLHGTIAKLECKDSYHHDSMPYNEIHCANGTWDNHLFNCKPVCGQRATKATPLAINAINVDFGDFPWHIGLYKKEKILNNTKLAFNCGGSIISPKLVITAAHCFLDLDSWRYQVAAGKVHRKFIHTMDQYAQYRDIVDIHISSKYDGQYNGYTADIAILILRDVFILSNLIQPICLDFNSRSGDIDVDSFGEVAGWGRTSEHGSLSDYLQYLSLPLKNYQQCKENVPEDFLPYVTFDKICAGFTNGTSVCEGDSGGGLVSKKVMKSTEKIYYLIGIVSTSPFKDDSCDSSKYATFTNVAFHIDWINETMYSYEAWTPYDYGCKLPEAPTFGNYTVSNDISDERKLMSGSLVPQYTKLTYFCSEGYALHGDQIITCKEKRWSVNNLLPQCFRKCSALYSSEYEIEYSPKIVGDFLLHETQAIFRCFDSNYELEAPAYNQTTCRDGEWTRPLLKCIPKCGIVMGSELSTRNETYAKSGEYPWIVGIYFVVNSSYNMMESSGAIISPFVVVTSVRYYLRDERTYLVVAGNTHNAFENHPNEMTQQSFVYKIMTIISGLFQTLRARQYILILKTPLKMTHFVRPICLSLSNPIPSGVNAELEMPHWIKNDDDLRVLKFKKYQPTMKLTSKIPVNGTAPLPSVFAVAISTPTLGTRYFLMGYGVLVQETIDIVDINKPKVISEVAQKYNIKADEMSECKIPDALSYAILTDPTYHPGTIVPVTTTIKYNCESSSYYWYSSENTCKNGSWTLPDTELVCIVCGTSELKNNLQLISPFKDYYTANRKDFPWHVGIYDKNHQAPELICSGSIISSKLILTHAQCFFDYTWTVFDVNRFAIAAGKLYSNWNNPLDTQAQFVDIDSMVFEYKRDLLLPIVAVLKKHLHITSYVSPVCLNAREMTVNSTIDPLAEIPIWSKEQVGGESLAFLRFSVKDQRGDIRINSSLPCKLPDKNVIFDKYNKDRVIIGSGVVTRHQINGENRYMLRRLVMDSRCSQEGRTIFEYNLNEHVNWLTSIIREHKR